MKPNIVFIVPDQHRGDVMGCAGNEVVVTPNLNALAAEGVRFTDVVCQSPLCQPARASLITGLYPHQHGVMTNSRGFPPPGQPNLMHLLRNAGYHTAAIGKVHIGNRPSRDARLAADHLRSYGFDYVDEEYGKMACLRTTSDYTERLAQNGLLDGFRRDLLERLSKLRHLLNITDEELAGLTLKEAWSAEPAPVPPDLYIDNHIGDRTVQWLSRYDRPEPLFLWVGFAGPHDPFDAPQAEADRYLAQLDRIPLPSLEVPEPSPSPIYQRMIDFATYYSGSSSLAPDRVKRLLAFYYANVTLIDRRIGDLIDVLSERRLLDNTWIVYTSDHGELGGTHRLIGKSLIYQESLRVPLIIRPPDGAGAVCAASVELNDVAATLLDIAGADPLPNSQAISLLPHQREELPGRNVRFSEVHGITSVLEGRFTYAVETESRAPALLWDHDLDRLEERNRVADPDYGEVRDRIRRELIDPFLANSLMEAVD